jgi:large subunit ribosomal protein L17
MKKRVFGRKLGRTKNQRQALFRALISSLITEGEIETTLAKAKAVKGQAEKLITRAKDGNLANRRLLLGFLVKRALVNRLAEGIAPQFKEKKGGYLRIVKTGRRKGDSAEMAKLFFTEEVKKVQPQEKKSPVVEEKLLPETKAEKPVEPEVEKARKTAKKEKGKND